MSRCTHATYVALSGGIGGAKLRSGSRSCCSERLAIIVNTGDDFEHLGLHISPDVDTALYTLAGLVNEETGWGRRDETWTFMQRARRARRADLVQAGRRRPGDACRSHRAARGGRDADRHLRAFRSQARHRRAHPAHDR